MLAMPCNTAHYWYDDLAAGCPVRFIHIVDAVADLLPAGVRELGIVATRATLRTRVFEQRLAERGIALSAPDEATYDRAVQPAIDAVKRGATAEGGRLLEPVIAAELERAAAVVLACTELPIALDAIASPLRARCIDSTDALARACVRHWTARSA
jgi:aspartate racemase